MRIRSIGVAVALGMSAFAWAQQDACDTDTDKIVADDPTARRIDSYVASLPEDGISGTILIRRNGETLLQRGFGCARRDNGIANTSDTLFDIGSIAKVFTAAAVLRLRDDGKLRLSDSIGAHLENVPQDKQSITIRQLLTHSAGLAMYHANGDFVRMNKEDALDATFSADLSYEPGTDSEYSNAGYAVLATIVEATTERPFQDVLRELVLEPLDLNDTGWYPDFSDDVQRTAQGFVGKRRRVKDVTGWRLTWALIGGGGMLSTTNDLARLADSLFHGDLLSDESKRDMTGTTVGSWACGWQQWKTDAGRTIEKGGAGNYGFTSIVQDYPDLNTTVILLFNSTPDRDTYPHNLVSAKIGSLLAEE